MRRGDVVIVAARGDYGKPRPAVVVQTDALPDAHESVIVCQMTSEIIEARYTRVTIEPSPSNGLTARSQIMVDKPTTFRRFRIGRVIGALTEAEIGQLDVALAFILGLAD